MKHARKNLHGHLHSVRRWRMPSRLRHHEDTVESRIDSHAERNYPTGKQCPQRNTQVADGISEIEKADRLASLSFKRCARLDQHQEPDTRNQGFCAMFRAECHRRQR